MSHKDSTLPKAPSGGYYYALKALTKLSRNYEKQDKFKKAFKMCQNCQNALNKGKFEYALLLGLKAHEMLEEISEARIVQGILKADIAAAYCNTGKQTEAANYARESIQIVKGLPKLDFTVASCNMTLGIYQYHKGESTLGAKFFQEARMIYGRLADSKKFLDLLNKNEQMLLDLKRKKD